MSPVWRRMSIKVLLILAGLVFVPTAARADLLLAPGSAMWEYTFDDPTSDTSWNTSLGLGGLFNWQQGTAPFGNQTSGDGTDPDFFYSTLWPADTFGDLDDDLWVRHQVDLSGYDLATVQWSLGVDNGFTLYANGNLITSANGEDYTFRWEYPDNTFGPSNSFLLPGVNVIALALEDHGVATAFDMEITGTPEPGSMILLGTGLLATATALRRRRAAAK